MAAAVAKSSARLAVAHLEWWSPQQALTMILTGDEAAADAAAIQNFADFEEEMKRRELAAWIGQAIDELYGAIRGAPLIECEGRRIDGEEAQCSLRGRRLRENEIRSIVADEIHDQDRLAAWRLVLRGNEIVLGANDHIEWRALEFERAGVLRAARWARRDGWLKGRVDAVENASRQRRLLLIDALYLVMEHIHPDGRFFAAMQDRSPKLLAENPPLWLVLRTGAPATANALWHQAKVIRQQAEDLLFTWLGEGSLLSYATGQSDGVVARGIWIGSEHEAEIYSSKIRTTGGNISTFYISNSEIITTLSHPTIRKIFRENSNNSIAQVVESMVLKDPLATARAIGAALHMGPRDARLVRALKDKREKLTGSPAGQRGRRPLKNIQN